MQMNKRILLVSVVVIALASMTIIPTASADTMLSQQTCRALSTSYTENPLGNSPIQYTAMISGTFTSYYFSPNNYIVRFDGQMGGNTMGTAGASVTGGTITGYGVSAASLNLGTWLLGVKTSSDIGFSMLGVFFAFNVWIEWSFKTTANGVYVPCVLLTNCPPGPLGDMEGGHSFPI